MLKTQTGSCHCKDVRYEAEVDLETGTMRCNCTYCLKTRNWTARVAPAHFRLLTDESKMIAYRPSEQLATFFCGRCGTTVFTRADIPQMGGACVIIRVSTLDISPAEMMSGEVSFVNGLENAWWDPAPITVHL